MRRNTSYQHPVFEALARFVQQLVQGIAVGSHTARDFFQWHPVNCDGHQRAPLSSGQLVYDETLQVLQR